jgi:hypothetical protein
MAQDHGTGQPCAAGIHGRTASERDAEQDHIRKLSARQRERAVKMRAEAAEIRARARRRRPSWPASGPSGRSV